MGKIITTPLPKDLPENWTDTQYVSPGGTEVGLTAQHGFNYLMKQVNNTQKAVQELDEGVDARLHHAGFDMLTPTNTGYNTLFDYVKSLYLKGVVHIVAKVNGFADMPRQEWGFTLIATNGEGDLWDAQLTEALTNRIFVRQLNTNSTWLQADWMKVVLSPLMEELVFDRNDTLGSVKLTKNSSATEDFGFTITDYGSYGEEAAINIRASDQIIEAAFKNFEGNYSSYELLHSGNFSNVAAPAGLVYQAREVRTNDDISTTITTWITSMPANAIRNFILSVNETNLNLGGGQWFITINKTSSQYAAIIATKHHTSGVYIKVCSLNERALTSWVNITPSAVAPATVE